MTIAELTTYSYAFEPISMAISMSMSVDLYIAFSLKTLMPLNTLVLRKQTSSVTVRNRHQNPPDPACPREMSSRQSGQQQHATEPVT